MIIIAFCTFVLGGCTNPHKQLFKTAITDFDAFRITTLLQKNPKQAENEIASFAKEPGWTLSFSGSEIVDFLETGNISCPFMANQTYFLRNPSRPNVEVLVNMLYLYDGLGWNLVSIWSKKFKDQEVISEDRYNVWEHDCEP
jgi:hypothetical protein